MKNFVCIDIGGTSIKHGVIDEKENFVTKDEQPTQAWLGGLSIVEKSKEIINNYKELYQIEGVCVSTAGIVGSNGEILHSGKQIPDYTGIQLKEILENNFNIPCSVENDVNCAGLAEVISGASKGTSVSVCLTIGTGIGGCIIINNNIFRGFNSSACEVGYMHLDGGEFQDLASTTALIENVEKRKGFKRGGFDGKKIFQLAKNGDIICIEEIDKMIKYLSEGIANICYIINPQVVVLGGGIMAQKHYLENKIKLSVSKMLTPKTFENTEIKMAENGNDAGMLGAYYCFKQKYLK